MSALPRCVPYVVVGVGAALGTGLRAATEHLWPAAPGGWPWTTFLINCIGALLLGLLQEWLARGVAAPWRTLTKLGVGTGVLGGFTTYSTYVMEALQSMRSDALVIAFAYLAVTVVLGVIFARLGLALGRARRPVPHFSAAHATGAGTDANLGVEKASGAPGAEGTEAGGSPSGIDDEGDPA